MSSSSRSSAAWLRRTPALLLLAVMCIPVLVARGDSPASPSPLPRVESQRVELLGRVGGLVTAGIPLSGSATLMSEGSALVRMQLSAAESHVLDQIDLGHGIILDVTQSGSFFYALTEEGVVVLRDAGGELPVVVSFVPGSGQSIDANGQRVAVAAREAGLRVLSVDAQGEVASSAVLPLDGAALDVALSADGLTAYIAAGEVGVHRVDLSDPANPALLGTLTQISPADAVGLAGSLLVVGSGEQAIIADPSGGAGAVVGTYSPLHEGRRVVADEEYLYVADAADGLKIIWLAATDRPVQIYGEAGRPALDLWLDDDLLYLVGPDGLRVLDVSSRFRPLELGHLELPGEPQGIYVEAGRAYVALGAAGAAVVSVENRSAPALVERYETAAPARAVLFDENVLYVAADEAGLVAVDFDAGGQGTPRDPFPLPGPALDIARRDNSLYIAGGEAGLLAVDISYPGTTTLAGVLPAADGQPIQSITLTGKRAYLGDGEGMVVADISYAQAMGRLTRLRVPTAHVATQGVYLYVLAGDRITVYDARATAEPVFMRTYLGLGHVSGISAAQGGRVYLSGAGDGPPLVVMSISSPDMPIELDSIGAQGDGYRAWAQDGEVWLARGYGGLSRFGLTEGGALVGRGSYSVSGEVGRIATGGTEMLVGGRTGWALLGMNGDNLPVALARSPDDLPVRGLAVGENVIAVAAGNAGVALYDLAEAGSGGPIAQREALGAATGVTLDDRFVYVADADGLSIYDNRYLQPVTSVAMPAPAMDIVARDGLAYFPLADGDLAVVDLADPTGGLRVRSIFTTRRPAALLRTPGGEDVYALVDDRLYRLRDDQPEDLISLGFSNLPEIAARGSFSGGSGGNTGQSGDALLLTLQPGLSMQIYDSQFMPAEEPVFRRELPTTAVDAALAPPLAYLALGDGGLALEDVTASGGEVIFYDQPVSAVLLDGDVLFAAGQTLTAWDVSNPVSPALLAELPLAAPGAHISKGQDGLLVSTQIGMTLAAWDGASLAEVGQLSTAGEVDRGVQLGDRAFLAVHAGGLLVVDLSDPASPSRLYSYTSPAGQFVNDLLLLNDETLLVSWEGGVEALDVSEVKPTPRLVSTVATGSTQALDLSMTADGLRGAVSASDEGVLLLDFSEAVQPRITGYVDTYGEANRVALDGSTLYVADGVCGLRVFDVADPAEPSERGYWRSSYASDVALGEAGNVYLAEANQLLTLHYDPDAAAVLPVLPQFPQPADGADSVPLSLDLAWGPATDECNPLTYQVYLGITEEPPFIGQVLGEPALSVSDLDPLRTYQWVVEATDRQGDVIRGPVWRFTTVAADFPDDVPAAPPPLTETLRDDQGVTTLLVGVGILAAVAVAYAWLRRGMRRSGRRQPPPVEQDWTDKNQK